MSILCVHVQQLKCLYKCSSVPACIVAAVTVIDEEL